MSITSFWFFVLISVGTAIYYVIPKKLQWMELLVLSMVFYYYAATPYTIIYLVAVTLIAYLVTNGIKVRTRTNKKKPYLLTILSIVIVLVIWLVVKGRGLWYPIVSGVFYRINPEYVDKIDGINIVAALGMGYFTLQVLGYIIDSYWENIEPQKNPIKLFLFVSYFPQLTTGPISRYNQLESLWQEHKFEYDNICMGAQRILWGIFKKIVIAERVEIIVSGIIGNPTDYYGFYSWMAVLLYPLQMYTDFSGCMDIVLGVSELFGINLAENFNNPFFARTSQEFWQRWHITLGTWAKDYVLYPLLKCDTMVRLGKYTRTKFGRKRGAFIKNCVGMFCLWMVMGIWHGGFRYILGVSLWYWTILMLGNLFAPVFDKTTKALEMKTDSFSWHLFQSIRTYLIYAIGATFFLCGIRKGLELLHDCAMVFYAERYANPWIFFNDSILNLGIDYRDLNIIIFGVLALFTVAILREKYGYARIWIKKQSFILRWAIWLFLFAVILVYGKYGPGYNAAEFIYQGF